MKRAALSIFLLGWIFSTAQAASFADPTRPPGVSEGAPAGASPAGSARLESVLIAPDRRVAVINGQQVGVGGKFADGEVIRITESEVVIRTGERLETLRLFPEYKRPPAPSDRSTP